MKTYYIYKGGRLTRPELKGAECYACRDKRGKCVRGRNSNMLVFFPEFGRQVVLARHLRKQPI